MKTKTDELRDEFKMIVDGSWDNGMYKLSTYKVERLRQIFESALAHQEKDDECKCVCHDPILKVKHKRGDTYCCKFTNIKTEFGGI